MSVDIVNISLGVDSRQVKDGTEALNGLGKQSGETETATDKLSGALKVSMVAAGATAVAFVAMVRATINAADAMNDMHLKTGLSFQSLAAYDQLARQSGTSLEGVASGFKFLSKNMVENSEKMAALGITSKNTEEAMAQFADVIAGVKDPALKTALAMEVLGRSGVELLPTLAGGSAAFEEARRSTEEYGKILELVSPMADRFNDEMEKVGTNVKTTALSITASLLPGLQVLAEELEKVTKAEAGGFGFLKTIFETIVILGANVAYVFRGIGIEIGGMAAQMAAIATLDFKGASEIGKMMKEDAAAARIEIDSFAERLVNAGKPAATDGAKEGGESDAKLAKIIAGKNAASEAAQKYILSLQNEMEMLGLNEDQKTMMEAAQQARLAGNEKEAMSIMTKATALVAERTRLDEVKQAAIQKEEVVAHNDKESAEILNRELERNKLVEESTKQLLAVQEAKYVILNDAAIWADATEFDRATLRQDREMLALSASYEAAMANHVMTEEEEERYRQAMSDIQVKHAEATRKAELLNDRLIVDGKIQYQKLSMAATSDFLGRTKGLMNSNSRAAFEIGKAAAISETVINTYASAIGAFKAFASIPYVGPAMGAVAAAAAIASGMAQVSAIRSTSFGSAGGAASYGGASSAMNGGQATTGYPTAPAPVAQEQQQQPIQISIYNTGTFVDAQAFVDNTIIPQIRDQITNSDVLLIDPRSRQAQVLGAA